MKKQHDIKFNIIKRFYINGCTKARWNSSYFERASRWETNKAL